MSTNTTSPQVSPSYDPPNPLAEMADEAMRFLGGSQNGAFVERCNLVGYTPRPEDPARDHAEFVAGVTAHVRPDPAELADDERLRRDYESYTKRHDFLSQLPPGTRVTIELPS